MWSIRSLDVSSYQPIFSYAFSREAPVTVQTGAVTAICATIDVIVFCVDNTGTHLIFNIPLSKLYTNSLMSSLNARGGWKFGGGKNNESSTNGVITKRVCQPYTSSIMLSSFVERQASQAVNLGSMTSGRPEVRFICQWHSFATLVDTLLIAGFRSS